MVPLTPDEIKNAANQATNLMGQLDLEEEKYLLVKREWNQKLKDLKLKCREFVSAFQNQARTTTVDVDRFYDLETKQTWDQHDGKEISRRDLDPYEVGKLRESPLFNDGPDLPGVKHEGDADGQDDEGEDNEGS